MAKIKPDAKLVEGLNAVQLKAVTHTSGPALVVAGPGTGKTTVISRRIAHLISSGSALPEEILALTFTDKAAKEMEERVDRLLPYGYVDTQIMTFHALGGQIIQDHTIEAGLKSSTRLASSLQQHVLLQQALEEMGELKLVRPAHQPGQYAPQLLSYFSRLKDEGLDSADYAKTLVSIKKQKEPDEMDWDLYDEVARVYGAYEALKQQTGFIDFGDQLLIPYKLLSNNPSIARRFQSVYKYILVDEFQDTNYIQAQLMHLLSKKHHNLMVVGDDDQSIYRFRGAELQNILDFSDHYKNTKNFVLSENYRSTQKVIDRSYDLIVQNNPDRLEVKLGINKHLKGLTNGVEPRLIHVDSLAAELSLVVDTVEKLLETESAEEIAILCRNNQQAGSLMAALRQRNLPVSTQQNQTLLQQPVVRQCIDFIRILHDPDDTPALYRYLISPRVGIGIATVIELTTRARSANVSLYRYIMEAQEQSQLRTILLNLEGYRELTKAQTPGELLYKFITDDDYLNGLVVESETDPVSAHQVRSLARFFEMIAELEGVDAVDNSHSLWSHIQTMYELDVFAEPDETEAQDGVHVLTAHRSKGLEFDSVILFDMTEGSFPAGRRGESLTLPQHMTETPDNLSLAHYAEERRLCYVAMTRARKNLIVTYSPDHGGKRMRKPSRFLYEAFGPDLDLKPVAGTGVPASIEKFGRGLNQTPGMTVTYPEVDGWIQLTPNQVSDYLMDPGMFYLRSVLKFPSRPHHRLTYGTALHAVFEVYFKDRQSGRTASLKRLLKVLEEHWSHQGFVSPRHEQERFAAARETIRRTYAKWNKLEFDVRAVESSFLLEIPQSKVRIKGRYDLVLGNDMGAEIRDFKTSAVSSEKSAADRVRDSIQLQIYALAWEKLQQEPVIAVSLDFVETEYLVRREKIDHKKTLNKIAEVADGIRSAQYPLNGYYVDSEAPLELL